MPNSSVLKDKVIHLRKTGLSYREINKILNVPKSTLSNWLHSTELTIEQKERLKALGRDTHIFASEAHTKIRLKRTREIFAKARADIRTVTKNDLWYMGIMLYWAEGSKQKEHNPSTGVIFSNSDPKMMKMFLKWIRDCLNISEEDICFEIYIHTTYQKSKESLIKYWSGVTGFLPSKFGKIYFKHNKVHSYRKNRGDSYCGVLRVMIRRSTDLNRQIMGWVNGICEHCGIV